MEGTFLNSNQRGTHPVKFLAIPTRELYNQFLKYRDVLKKMTIAPELEVSVQLVRDFKKNDIIAAAGHKDGIYLLIIQAVIEEITHATHFFCNISHFHRHNLMRVASVVMTLLCDPWITGELIADGWYIDPILMKLLVKVKGTEKVRLVTDAIPGAGMPDGRYFIGDVEAIVEKGIVRLPDNSAYAGSITTMDICLKNAVYLMELSFRDTLRTVTLTPYSDYRR